MREEVLEKRAHLVTTEADLKLGVFFEEEKKEDRGYGSGSEADSGYASDDHEIGVIGDERPAIRRRDAEIEDGWEYEEVLEERETPREQGPESEDMRFSFRP